MEEIIGKTIKKCYKRKIKGYDDEYILLKMTDGSIFRIEGGYDNKWTGRSLEEYSERVSIKKIE